MARRRRPEFVRIGPFTYAVTWPEHVLDVDTFGNDDETLPTLSARADHYALAIQVSSTLARPVQRKSLLHEVIHACNWISGHDDTSSEEQFVRALAFPLLDVLRDNPVLVAFLTEPD